MHQLAVKTTLLLNVQCPAASRACHCGLNKFDLHSQHDFSRTLVTRSGYRLASVDVDASPSYWLMACDLPSRKMLVPRLLVHWRLLTVFVQTQHHSIKHTSQNLEL